MKVFPWSLEEAQARGFRIKQQDGFTLITPNLKKTQWQFNPDDPYANDSELVWRSALLNERMEAVSLGFPKFGNHGQWGFEELDKKIERSISDRTALLTAKEDGTLVIRSVYEGKVIWRTRNSFDLGPFHDPVMVLSNLDPLLPMPEYYTEYHMLFEYVSPTNQIIIKYDVPNLILLAIRQDHRLLQKDEWYWPSGPHIRTMRMSFHDPIGLQKEISELERDGLWDSEGVVVRTPDGLMSKIKGSEYLKTFRVRYFFKYGDFAALCLSNKVTDLSEAKSICIANGVDWEAVTCVEDWFKIYSERHSNVNQNAIWAQDHARGWIMDNPNGLRKDFANWVQNNAPNDIAKALCFVAYDGKSDRWKSSYEKARNKAIFAPVTIEYKNPWFSLQEEA